ncbi:MAG: ATP-dependent Clp protease adaptor ClpS [Spirochaetaceae bacterium]|nr:ATP-dependent Clp protease adaptor ClpS [Spirochaetaceae bacterium]
MDKRYSESTETDFLLDLQEPSNYKVIFFNDDYTTKDFVVDVLTKIFHKSEEEAIVLMETVHTRGQATVGIYTYDIAATKVSITVSMARQQGFPLRCQLEEVD